VLTESRVSVHELGCSRLLPSSVGVFGAEPLPLPLPPRRVLLKSASARAVLLAAAAAACGQRETQLLQCAQDTHETLMHFVKTGPTRLHSGQKGGSAMAHSINVWTK